jgi:hypothetical protein
MGSRLEIKRIIGTRRLLGIFCFSRGL